MTRKNYRKNRQINCCGLCPNNDKEIKLMEIEIELQEKNNKNAGEIDIKKTEILAESKLEEAMLKAPKSNNAQSNLLNAVEFNSSELTTGQKIGLSLGEDGDMIAAAGKLGLIALSDGLIRNKTSFLL